MLELTYSVASGRTRRGYEAILPYTERRTRAVAHPRTSHDAPRRCLAPDRLRREPRRLRYGISGAWTVDGVGLNTAGLSCDKQSLGATVFPPATGKGKDVDGALLCKWALEGFGKVSSLREGLKTVNFIAPAHDVNFANGHWVLRDAHGDGVVIEFIEGRMKLYEDRNDGGKTGFGAMTNSPEFPWQVEAMRFRLWKEGKWSPTVTLDGSWYPDARFQRVVLVKSKMAAPTSLQMAVSQAVQVLNTVTVPTGSQPGKDMDSPEDHRTEFAVIYDHKNAALYWRSVANPSLARLRLDDANLAPGAAQRVLLVQSPGIPWFHDAAGGLRATQP